MKHINKKGETIIETLVAILIVAVCFLMLQTSIVSAAKINKSSEEENVPFIVEGRQEIVGTNCSIAIERGTSQSNVSGYSCYKTSGGYYYYEKDK